MQPQLIRKDGSTIPLSDEQYQQVLDVLGLGESEDRLLSKEEAEALLDKLEDIGAEWGLSTKDWLEERRRERELERRREKRHNIP